MRFEVARAKEEDRHLCDYDKNFNSKTFFVLKESKMTIAKAYLTFINQIEAKLEIEFLNHTLSEDHVFRMFCREIIYFNGQLQIIVWRNQIYRNPNFKRLKKMAVKKIQPSQLMVSEKKLGKVDSWVSSPKDYVIPTVKIDGKHVATDGHTRLVHAAINNVKHVYVYEDDAISNILYHDFYNWCQNENIKSPHDLKARIVDHDTHKNEWVEKRKSHIEKLKRQKH